MGTQRDVLHRQPGTRPAFWEISSNYTKVNSKGKGLLELQLVRAVEVAAV